MQPENSEVSEEIRKSKNSCRISGAHLRETLGHLICKLGIALEVIVVVIALVLRHHLVPIGANR